MIPYGRQFIDSDDVDAVVRVLKSDFLTTGPKTEEFENKLAEYFGAKYAVVFNSGTSALHASYFTVGLKENDEFITTPNTFTATSNAGLCLNAKPVFCDIESDTGNINADLIESKITEKTKLLVPVHYAGQPCDLEKIKNLAEKYNLKIIEDACHSIGSKYKNFITGNCRFSDMTVFSFHPVKHITTGEGGAVLTNNKKYRDVLKMFRNHGLSRNADNFFDLKTNEYVKSSFFNKMFFLGHNYRMTDIQAALGISQLEKLKSFVERRREIVSYYNRIFEDNDFFELPVEKEYSFSSWHLYFIRLKKRFTCKRNLLVDKLIKNGIGVQVHYPPVYFHPYYQNLGYGQEICPKAEEFFFSEISLPLYPALTNENIRNVTEIVFKTCKEILK